MISIENQGILVYAMRYSLGRRSYAVSDVCAEVRKNADNLNKNIRNVMIRDIKEAEKLGDIGDACDEAEWLRLLEILERMNMSEEGGV